MDISIIVNSVIAFGTIYILFQNNKFRNQNKLNETCKERHIKMDKMYDKNNGQDVSIELLKAQGKGHNADITEIKNDIKLIFSKMNELKDLIINNNRE